DEGGAGYGDPGWSYNGSNSVFPGTYNNARYDACFDKCMGENSPSTMEKIGCGILGAASKRFGKWASKAANKGCQAASQALSCQRQCEQEEKKCLEEDRRQPW